ncbi:NACHT domain-containing protein [Streptomyces sp. NPDC059567]|uniref:NACHT domain-containing protein n=1 Tax=Streptomyces sp. NPDC059567 TaxID=3346867 RepID=UPI0036BBDA06
MDHAQQRDGVVATVVVDRYRGDVRRVRERPQLRPTASRFVEQARRLGFAAPSLHVASAELDAPAPRLSAGREQIRDLVLRLGQQAVDRKILYWTGHGEVVAGAFYLACEDSYEEGRFDPARAVSAEELVSWLAEDATDTLLVLDACFAGEAVGAVSVQVEGARDRLKRAHAGFAVVATADSEQEAMEGHWVDCLEQVLSTPGLLVDGRARIFRRDEDSVFFQHLMLAVSGRTRGQVPRWREVRTLRPGFLLNPHWSPRVGSALRPEDDESWIGKEFRSGELPVFSDAGDSWNLRDFASRDRVVAELVDWLRVRESGMFTVTGASGAGKSTLLAYVAHLTVDSFVASLPTDRRPRAVPELRSVNAAIHCRGKTLAGLCEELAACLRPLDLRAGPGRLSAYTCVEAVRNLAERKGSLTLMFDGLDEAAAGHSFDIARGLLNPLAAQPRVRVVVATRPNARRNLPGDLPVETLLEVLHCMQPLELDRTPEVEQDIARHVERLLGEEDSPYSLLPDAAQTRGAVARYIADRSKGLFLVATLWARHLAQLSTPPDVTRLDRELRPGTAVLDSLLADELDRLDPQDPLRVRDFMRALALAQGVGLPQPRVWLDVTNTARGPDSREYDADDLRAVIRAATGVTIAKDSEFGTEVYRLHHPSFGAHLLEGEAEQRRQHRAVYRTLTPEGGEDWQDAEPYVAHYLAAHAALAGDDALEELVEDHHFLVAAEPDLLEPLVAARLAITRQSALYLRVADHFRKHPSPAPRWAVLRATALAMFSPDFLATVPKPSFVFWDDVWSSAERLPLRRSRPAPSGGALAVHWEAQGDGIIHVAGAGEITSWTADGRETRSRTTGPATWASPPTQRGVTASGRGESRVIAAHDSQCVRMWHGRSRYPVEELYWGGSPVALDSVRRGGEVFLAVVDAHGLWVWRWDSTVEYARKRIHPYHVTAPERFRCVALVVCAGRVAVVAGGTGGVTVWEVLGLKTGQDRLVRVRSLDDGAEVVRAVSALAPGDGPGAVIAALDGHTLRRWHMDDLFGGEAELRFGTGTAGGGVALGRGPQGLLTAVREDAAVRVWDEAGGEYVPLPCNHSHMSLAFDPAGTGRLAVADDNQLQVWEPHAPDGGGGAALAVQARGRQADGPQLRTKGGPDGTLLLARSQGSDVLLSLHTASGHAVDGPRLAHPSQEVGALGATWVGDGWLTAAVGRRRVLLRRFGPRLELLESEEFELPGASDLRVPSIDLGVTGTGRIRLMWPSGQSVVTWERDGTGHGAWSEGRTFWMGGAGAVQQVELVEVPGGPSWLSLWGGNAVRVWDLGRPDGRPEPVTVPGATAVATGVLRRVARAVPLVAFATRYTVEFAECDGGIDVSTPLPEQPGGPLDGLTLAGPPERPLLIGWSRKSGRLRLWDVRRERSLDPMESRGYDVTNVDSVYDGRRITLMIQGIAQNRLRCDQVVLPWRIDEDGPAPRVVRQRVAEATERRGGAIGEG